MWLLFHSEISYFGDILNGFSEMKPTFTMAVFFLLQTPEARTLDQIMQSSPEKRDSILSNMKEALAVTVEKYVDYNHS